MYIVAIKDLDMIKKYISIKNNTKLDDNISLAIGFFDGLHLGHKVLIDELKNYNSKKAIITFKSDFKSTLKKEELNLLLLDEEKDRMLTTLGIDYEYIFESNEEILKTSKEDFLKYLDNQSIKNIVVGEDFTFGKFALGKAGDLLSLNSNIIIKPLLEINKTKISTTYIKSLLLNNKIDKVNQLLGYDFSISGVVIHGLENGRKINYPTANINYPLNKFKLNSGVYKTITIVNNREYQSMTNIGTHPTIASLNEDIIESHIFDFNKDIYGKEITIIFKQFIREQKKFNSLDELKNQLNIDKNIAIRKD